MKRFISFLLIFVLILLCACSFPAEIEECVTLDLTFLQDKTITNIDNNDRYILIRCVPFVEEAYYAPICELSYYYVWDIERNKLKSSWEQEDAFNDDNYISEIEIDGENQITLYTYNNPTQSQVYDLSFQPTGNCNESYVSREEKQNAVMKSNDLINADRFARYGNFATDTLYINNAVSIFLDDPDNVYISDYDNTLNVMSTNGKLVLTGSCTEDGTSITYCITDYERLVKREIEVEYGKYAYPCFSSMSDKYTVVGVTDESGKCSRITVINNSCGTVSAANIVKIPSTDIDSKISSIQEKIENQYGIETELAPEYDKSASIHSYYYENDDTKAEMLLTMYDFEKCLSTFPNEFYSEIIRSDISFDKLKFYFVGRFDSERNSQNVDAYCSNIDGELFIVYSVHAFTYSTFCHELMHAMEYRIAANIPDFDYEWNLLNPNGFEYVYFNSESNPFYENEENQKYFARDYGTNNELEDRATVFEEICYSDFQNEASPWWAKYEPLSQKAAYLKTAITKSYPSLSRLWEKYDSIFENAGTVG